MKKQRINSIIKYMLLCLSVYLLTTLTGSLFPFPNGNYIHIGDVAIYLIAAFCPLKTALVCSIFASASDITLGAYNYALATLVIKAVTVIAVKILVKMSDKPLVQDVLVCFGGTVTICGYYFADVILQLFNKQSFINAVSLATDPLIYNVSQALLCAVIYIAVSGFVRSSVKSRKRKAVKKHNDNA